MMFPIGTESRAVSVIVGRRQGVQIRALCDEVAITCSPEILPPIPEVVYEVLWISSDSSMEGHPRL